MRNPYEDNNYSELNNAYRVALIHEEQSDEEANKKAFLEFKRKFDAYLRGENEKERSARQKDNDNNIRE